jgi:NADP-dependent 3-hydroxy acid dehydrogenase YdfG
VIILSRSEEKLKKALVETGAEGYIAMDATHSEDWESIAYPYIQQKYGKLDVLVNNAGGAVQLGDVVDMSSETVDRIISLNLNSAIYGAKTFAGMMMAQKSGTIVNVASACAKHAWPGWSVYAAAKWGVLGFSKNLYVDLQPYGVRVSCLIPGAGATDFMKHAGAPDAEVNLTAEDVGRAMFHVATLPDHLVVEEMIIWGSDQRVVPL